MSIIDYMAIWPLVITLWTQSMQLGLGLQGKSPLSYSCSVSHLQKKSEESESKRKKEVNLVISHAPSADNSNLSADGDDSFISVEMDSAMPSPFSEVRVWVKPVKQEGFTEHSNSLSCCTSSAFKLSNPTFSSHPVSSSHLLLISLLPPLFFLLSLLLSPYLSSLLFLLSCVSPLPPPPPLCS